MEAYESMDPEIWGVRHIGTTRFSNLCVAYHLLGEHEKELETARLYGKLYPDLIQAGYQKIEALAALGRIRELDQTIDECLRVRQPHAGQVGAVFQSAVDELRRHGHRDDALRLANRAVDYYSNRPPREASTTGVREWLAVSLYYAERWEEAQAVYEQLAAETPGSLWYKGRLGTIAARLGDRREALRLLDELQQIDRPAERFLIQGLCARIAAQLGDFDRAVELLLDALAHGLPYYTSTPHADMDLEPLRGYQPFEDLVRPKG
jgi:tetratricopeptide (TPR) repeat protein